VAILRRERMKTGRRAAMWMMVAWFATAATARADDLRIRPTVADKFVVVSFELEDAYTAAVKEAISSGLKTTFTYDLELRTKSAVWMDRTVATSTITITDQYDNLMRRHTLTRAIDGRVEEVTVTEDEAVVRAW